jgi:hypothetical protein
MHHIDTDMDGHQPVRADVVSVHRHISEERVPCQCIQRIILQHNCRTRIVLHNLYRNPVGIADNNDRRSRHKSHNLSNPIHFQTFVIKKYEHRRDT